MSRRPDSPMRRAASLAKAGRVLVVAVVVVIAASLALSGSASGPAADSAATAASERYAVRGVYDRDLSTTGFDHEAAVGFNFIDSAPSKDQMDQLAVRGLKGFVWLGGYSNTTCKFNRSDDWLRSHVTEIAGNPGVGAYLVDDEPDAAACPTAPAQMKVRANLVKSIDPGPPTVIVTHKVDQLELFKGTVDVLALNHYPCSIKNGCDYSKIDRQAAEADRLGVRYWGVIQATGDDWYKVPTPDELHQQFVHWRATNMEGYLVYAWRSPDDTPSLWLANNPALMAALKQENGVPGPGKQYALRGVYDRDLSASGFDHEAAIGFNLIDSGPYKDQMDELRARGLKGLVWLGGYSNTTCTFTYSNDWVRSHVAAIAGHPGVGAYMIDDEPNAAACPTAPAQMKVRANLVRSIDPGPPTLIVTYKVNQFKLFAGTVDLLALDHYPCSIKNGCDYSKIDAQAAEADRLGIRYWGVIQAAGDTWYKVPTPAELHQQFVHWRATNMEGYLVFAWRYPDKDPTRWLANNAGLKNALRLENGVP